MSPLGASLNTEAPVPRALGIQGDTIFWEEHGMPYYLALAQPGDPQQLYRVVEENLDRIAGIIFLGGLPCPEQTCLYLRTMGLEVYAVTGPMDDHFVAKTCASLDALVEGRIRATGSGVLLAGINGRDPVTSITQLEEKLRPYRGRVVVAGYHGVKGCADKLPGIGAGVGLYEAKHLVLELEPLMYISGRTPRAGVCRLGETLVIYTGWLELGEYVIIDLAGLYVYWRGEKLLLLSSSIAVEDH